MRRGFTLVELAAVIVVTSVIAISAAPVLSRIGDARRGAFAREVERLLELARSRALDTGNPAGIRVDTSGQVIELVEITDAGVLREFMEDYAVSERMPGVSIASHTLGHPASVWFWEDGTPHLRAEDGTFLNDLDASVGITIEGGATVSVEPTSGRITR